VGLEAYACCCIIDGAGFVVDAIIRRIDATIMASPLVVWFISTLPITAKTSSIY
jgi:hypothetical protein